MSGAGRARRLRSSNSESGEGDDSTAAPSRFPKSLMQIYEVGDKLGEGGNSTVWRCVHKVSGKTRAVKKVDTSDMPPSEIAYEIAIMRLLRHESVVKCHDVFIESQFVNIVVDLFSGGDLISGLREHRTNRGSIPSSTLARITSQMMAAVAHVHGLGVIHRDVKGENFLTDRNDIGDRRCRVALADFGTAVMIENEEKLSVQVGTRAFWPPELWGSNYDRKIDVWAVGVTAYVLLAGSLPFNNEEEMMEVCTCPEPSDANSNPRSLLQLSMAKDRASADCNDFIFRCLALDPLSRPSAEELLEHSFLTTPQRDYSGGGLGSVILSLLGSVCVCFCHGASAVSELIPAVASPSKPAASSPLEDGESDVVEP